MDEKIYCSQCHNSAFVGTNKHIVPVRLIQYGYSKCLYCFVFKRFMQSGHKIPYACQLNHYFQAESAEKLRAGIWNARTEYQAIRDCSGQ